MIDILWIVFGLIYLIWQSVTDWTAYKVDERHSFFMMGYTLALGATVDTVWWHTLVVVLLAVGGVAIMSMLKVIREGDNVPLIWCSLGWFFLFGFEGMQYFYIYLCACFVVIFVLLYVILKNKDAKLPFIPFMLMSFICTILSFYL